MYVYVIALRNANDICTTKTISTHPELNRNTTKHFSWNFFFQGCINGYCIISLKYQSNYIVLSKHKHHVGYYVICFTYIILPEIFHVYV